MPDIKGYENLYFVTSCGKVWSYKYKKFLSPDKSGGGYYRVSLNKNGVAIHKLVHRLVAESYIPNPNNLPEVNHKDENKSNNSLSNLEWSSEKNNANYGTRNERISKALRKGVICITTGEVFRTQREAADKFGIPQWHISNCCTGIVRQVKGLVFKHIGG